MLESLPGHVTFPNQGDLIFWFRFPPQSLPQAAPLFLCRFSHLIVYYSANIFELLIMVLHSTGNKKRLTVITFFLIDITTYLMTYCFSFEISFLSKSETKYDKRSSSSPFRILEKISNKKARRRYYQKRIKIAKRRNIETTFR